jgi:rubrerythrin
MKSRRRAHSVHKSRKLNLSRSVKNAISKSIHDEKMAANSYRKLARKVKGKEAYIREIMHDEMHHRKKLLKLQKMEAK